MTIEKNIYLTPDELTPELITNLYLYGQVTRPESGKRSDVKVIIHMDMAKYMSEGAGRYAHISKSPLVREFIIGLHDLPNGNYNISDLRNYNFTEKANFSFNHVDIDKDSGDYAQRVYNYGHAPFKLSEKTIFVVKDGKRYLEKASILAFDDDFDFQSRGLSQFGNIFVLEPEIDPAKIGKMVNIEYKNKENVFASRYDVFDYIDDRNKIAIENKGTFYDAYRAMKDIIIPNLISANIISTTPDFSKIDKSNLTVTVNTDPESTSGHSSELTQTGNVIDGGDHEIAGPIEHVNGDGVELISYADSEVTFDVDNDQMTERTGWVSGSDGMLVHDKDGDGVINDITETISEYYNPEDGSIADVEGKYSQDGLDALSKLDSNGDDVFNSQDVQWDNLRVWTDANEDGITDEGELRTLDAVGVQSIGLGNNIIQAYKERNEGNVVLSRSTYTDINGNVREAAAVDFTTNPIGYEFNDVNLGKMARIEELRGEL